MQKKTERQHMSLVGVLAVLVGLPIFFLGIYTLMSSNVVTGAVLAILGAAFVGGAAMTRK